MDDIRRIFDESGAKDYSLKMIDKLFLNSINLITNIDFLDDEHKNILLGFAEFLKVRNK